MNTVDTSVTYDDPTIKAPAPNRANVFMTLRTVQHTDQDMNKLIEKIMSRKRSFGSHAYRYVARTCDGPDATLDEVVNDEASNCKQHKLNHILQ